MEEGTVSAGDFSQRGLRADQLPQIISTLRKACLENLSSISTVLLRFNELGDDGKALCVHISNLRDIVITHLSTSPIQLDTKTIKTTTTNNN